MNLYGRLLIGTIVLIAGTILFLWIVLIKSRNHRVLNMRDASLTNKELEDHAKETAIEHSVSYRQDLLYWPVPRMKDNYNDILSVYKGLNEDIQKKYSIPSDAEWLLDSFYIIEEQVKVIRRDLTKKSYSRLPVLKTGPLKGYARIFAVAVELVAHTDGQMDETILRNYLKAYQSQNVLFDREIEMIPIVMRLALIENIRLLCENIKDTQLQWHRADEIIDSWLANEGINDDRIAKLLRNNLKVIDEANSSFIEHLFYRLRRSGRSYAKVLKTIDDNLIKHGITTEIVTQMEHNFQSINTISMGNCITSLKLFSTLDWNNLFESVSFVEAILSQDPDGTYPLMDFFTRKYYRSRIEKLASIHGVSELYIAQEVVELAKNACSDCKDEITQNIEIACTCHVGYYLMGNGIKSLEERQRNVKNYLGSIGLIIFILVGIAVQYSFFTSPVNALFFSILASIVVLIPSSEISVCIVNWIACKAIKQVIFPRLELKEGIPSSMSTMVLVPIMLSDERRVKEILEKLETHYLSNREENLYFALIKISKYANDAEIQTNDKTIETILHGVKELNRKYAREGTDKFYFFHRLSQFNEKSFSSESGSLLSFSNIVYVITLDSDMILPMCMAKKMIGTIAHPLNRPVIDNQRGIVIKGYGLMQPRIDFDYESSNMSIFSRIFSGHMRTDPYANTISDIDQSLFGEGILIGKGIYDLKVFQSIIKNATLKNAILSHDSLEGFFVRTALVSDLQLLDSYSSEYHTFATKLHRRVIGDWRLFQLLRGKHYNRSHRKNKNPLTLSVRWKVFNNLRRSLVPPSLMLLSVLSYSILPGNSYFWIGYLIIPLTLPFITTVIDYLFSRNFVNDRRKQHIPVILELKTAFFRVLLSFVFLPYQAYLMADAIRSGLKGNLLEKKNRVLGNSVRGYIYLMNASLWEAFMIVILAAIFKPEVILISILFMVIWISSPFIAYCISREKKEAVYRISKEDICELGRITRKTWRYFEEFANFKNHYLAPDNFQEDPPRGVAYRTSPTNIGLGLMAILTARDFGYIGTYEMIEMISNTICTLEKLEKWNGHLYNWYDTRTLKPLRPKYISTVDSGNLVSYLITLEQGLSEFLSSPFVDVRFINGIRDTLHSAGKEGIGIYEAFDTIHGLQGRKSIDMILWKQMLGEFVDDSKFDCIKRASWKIKIKHMIRMLKKEMMEFMPGIDLLEKMPQKLCKNDLHIEISADAYKLISLLKNNANLQDLPSTYRSAADCMVRLVENSKKYQEEDSSEEMVWLCESKEILARSIINIEKFIERYQHLMERIHSMSEATKFLPLYAENKQLFSIGYHIEENKLTNSYYDLLASEARQTSYIAIARGEIPSEHWFKLGRTMVKVDGYKGLVSWTGTMFEYLMPLVVMKKYTNTLLDETYSFVIRSQKKYCKQRGMPWGVSESGFNSLDINLDYQYKAIGVPWLGLKRGLIEDAVATPYATFLALLVDPKGAMLNIKLLKKEGMDGHYGFYEAADYTQERLPYESKRAIIKSFMAHHQGMSLMALNNYLHENIMQRRFHADPIIKTAQFLLQEKIPAHLVFTKGSKEKVISFKEWVTKEKNPARRFNLPDPILPKAHILSNGNYSIMITDRGTGYSKNKMVAVTRWREDSILDQYGMFFYVKNVDTNSIWSATYAPLNVLPEKYKVIFSADKAYFKRVDGDIETETEVIVTSGDNAEIRRISIKNRGIISCILEVTSYFEVVLVPQTADSAHPAFSNLFVKTEYLADKKCIIANRRPRSESDKSFWIVNSVVVEGETIGDIQFETDRVQFIGRGYTHKNPIMMQREKPLSNTVGPVLDPMMSIKVRVKIEPGKTIRISFVTAVSESNELLLGLIEKYATVESIEGAFRLTLTRSQVETRYLNMNALDVELYQDIISNILFISPIRRIDQSIIQQNIKGQSSLWAYGISGDLPIILVILKKTDEVEILYEILKAHEYWCLKDLKVDVVILNEEENSYILPLHALISDIVLAGKTHNVLPRSGDVFLLDKDRMPLADIYLLHAVARVVLKGDAGMMSEQFKIKQINELPKLKQFVAEAKEYENNTFDAPNLLYFNGLGGFSTEQNEYVIRLENDQNTPAPWINVIANPKFGFIVSEAGSGYTWCENSRENKLSPWSNDPVSDSPGEILYIGDGDTGELWTVTSLPIREDEPYIIRHGFGYSIFEHISHGIKQNLVQFVPVNESVKVSLLQLENITDQKRNLILTYYVRPVLGVSDQVTSMHIKTGVSDSGTLLIENPYSEEFAGKISFMDVSLKERSVTGDRKEFFGSEDASLPEALKRERLSGAIGAGLDPCAVMQTYITLQPNESKEIVFLFGMGAHLNEVNELTNKYREIQKAREALWDVKKFWKGKLETVQVNTPITSMDLMMDGWLQYQVISCRLWARSGFYQSGGAFGFRDQLQDCLSIAHIWPEIARSQILIHAQHQFTEGDVQHWWHDPLGKGTRTRFSDDLLWLPYVTAEYIRITGDHQILKTELTFLQEEALKEFEDEKYGMPAVSIDSSSLFEHCVRAIEKAMKFGEHNLPLMGSGDWNDGMNTVGNKGSGESVWLGWFLCSVLEMFAPICMEMGEEEKAEKYTVLRKMLGEALEEHAWDGSWYRRAYFDNGLPLGSIQNSECKIDAIAQAWAVLSGAGNPQRAVQAMNSLEDYLVQREDGLIKLLTPPFDEGDLEPGYIKGYVPGVRENGGQYTHAAAWVIIAFAKLGEGDKAWELFELVNPINHSRNYQEYSRYKVEPYVMAADVYAVYPHTGRGGWTWYTGSAGWIYRAGLEYILGFQKNGDTIIMDPCIPKKWAEYTITYQYLDTQYVIKVKNPEGLNKGVKMISEDGKATEANMIKLANDGKLHAIEVFIGL